MFECHYTKNTTNWDNNVNPRTSPSAAAATLRKTTTNYAAFRSARNNSNRRSQFRHQHEYPELHHARTKFDGKARYMRN